MNNIKSFSVYGLFGAYDVHIPFDEEVKILIGENGLGKTQILNIFYYTLVGDFFKLSEFIFDRVELKIGGELISFTRNDVNEGFKIHQQPLAKKLIKAIGFAQFEALRSEFDNDNILFLNNLKSPRYVNLRKIASIHELHQLFYMYNDESFNINRGVTQRDDSKLNSNLKKCSDSISRNINNDVLYFPTFRRVEEDLHNLGYKEDRFLSKDDKRLIHFGMDDVQKRFKSIEKKIDLLLKEGFTKISSEILSKLVKGFGKTNMSILDRVNETDMEIILARVGNQISESDKSRIREIVRKKEVSSDADNAIFYFLQTLTNIYEKQKKFDDAINNFKEVCNQYLIGKNVIYDESEIKIYIASEVLNEPLPLNKLSSGEKQIISIFSKIYLADEEQSFIVLFDEPELSLSMLWQQKLLPDIVNSQKCDFLLAVTHSPFIFDNELDEYAVGLNEYIKPIRKLQSNDVY